jgi:hypothetical protein
VRTKAAHFIALPPSSASPYASRIIRNVRRYFQEGTLQELERARQLVWFVPYGDGGAIGAALTEADAIREAHARSKQRSRDRPPGTSTKAIRLDIRHE